MSPHAQLDELARHLDRLRADELGVADFASHARRQTILLKALEPRYLEVLNQLLDRLESAALFSEESCSFSQRDLLDSLQLWVDKVRARLGTP